jgi:hypothetical protein
VWGFLSLVSRPCITCILGLISCYGDWFIGLMLLYVGVLDLCCCMGVSGVCVSRAVSYVIWSSGGGAEVGPPYAVVWPECCASPYACY